MKMELFHTEESLFTFLRMTPRLVVFGEGTDRLIAQYAGMSPKFSIFWHNFKEVLAEGKNQDYTSDWQCGSIAYVERDIHWRMAENIPIWTAHFWANFECDYENFKPQYDVSILSEECWESYWDTVEMQWEEIVEYFTQALKQHISIQDRILNYFY